MSTDRRRCAWVSAKDPEALALYQRYHDEEWGVPSRDERHLFEMLILEGAQAGLSWLTVLKKREGYRRAFDGFDPMKIVHYGERDRERLLADPGIVRNRAKVDAAVGNARAYLGMREEGISPAEWLWGFVNDVPIRSRRRSLSELPAQTPESEAMSKALKKRGFRFVGPTICYAFMQAVGMVNDHTTDCFRYGADS
jgi:DNA-3-methyladenine glycosylase I